MLKAYLRTNPSYLCADLVDTGLHFALFLLTGFLVGVFTALHVMQTRSSNENSVCPSVCPSVCLSVTRVNCDKTVERSVQVYIPYER